MRGGRRGRADGAVTQSRTRSSSVNLDFVSSFTTKPQLKPDPRLKTKFLVVKYFLAPRALLLFSLTRPVILTFHFLVTNS